jgi:D-alanyl-D-alanine-carboxypeptidase/D-alanyl-D-alanine-endopeptidase
LLSIAIGLLILTGSSGRRAAAGADEETLRMQTDRLVQPYLDNDVIVGMTIGVLRQGKQEVFGYGRMSRNDRRVPDGDTIYEFGSATKVLTGILLADAVVSGQVKLDQPARELLPKGVKMPAKGNRAITLQDLSTHVSGLPTIPDNMKLANPDNPYADYREEHLYAFLNNYKLARAPGTKNEYSNLGQGLLGHLLSLRAKSTYEDLVRNRIAVPLKMTSTRITIDKESKSRFAPGHMADGQPAANWDLPVLAGAGGVRTTVNDMLLFAAANLAPPKGKLGGAMELAWTIHQKPITKGDAPLGLGWHVAVDGTRWHNGETGGYHSMILVNRQSRSSVILLTNTATREVDQLASDILKMISGAKVAPRTFEKSIAVSAEALQKLVGSYELAPNVLFTVKATDGKLMIALTGQPSYQVFPRSETLWFYKVVDATITFNVDKNGKCDSLVLFQNGIKQTAKRKKVRAGALQ